MLPYPSYSAFPAAAGTIKPDKNAYANLSLMEIVRQAKEEGLEIKPPDFYETIHRFPKGFRNSLDWEALALEDSAPVPATCDRENYHGDRHLEWWLSGLMTWLWIKSYCLHMGKILKPGSSYFELGCASGRVLRHVLFQEPGLHVTGCDINARHVDWMQKFLPKRATVFQNTAWPSLPLGDESMDIIVACSVFTHIDDLESAWLMELRRILKPGGVCFITFMSNMYWQKCGYHESWQWIADSLLQMRCEYELTPASFLAPMPAERITLGMPGTLYNTTIFHHVDYISRVWGRYLKVAAIIEAPFDIQDLAVMIKE